MYFVHNIELYLALPRHKKLYAIQQDVRPVFQQKEEIDKEIQQFSYMSSISEVVL